MKLVAIGIFNLKNYLEIDYGPALIEHVLLEFGFPSNSKIGTQFDINRDLPKLHLALKSAENIMQNIGTTSKVLSIQYEIPNSGQANLIIIILASTVKRVLYFKSGKIGRHLLAKIKISFQIKNSILCFTNSMKHNHSSNFLHLIKQLMNFSLKWKVRSWI